jgi:hypothetical protein
MVKMEVEEKFCVGVILIVLIVYAITIGGILLR